MFTDKQPTSTPYEDVVHLRVFCFWPRHKVPEWAEERARELQTNITNSCVLERNALENYKQT